MTAPHTRALLGAVLALVVASGEAAERRLYRIGVLNEAWAANHPTVQGLKSGLNDLGIVEGRDVSFDIRFTQGDPKALPAAAEALVKAGADLIFTCNEAATNAAKKATDKLPVVFTLVGDAVRAGLVKQRVQPGGNLTGVTNLAVELTPKRIEVLKSLFPSVRRVWILYEGNDATADAMLDTAREAARRLHVEIVARGIQAREELPSVLRELRQGDALLAPEKDALDIGAMILEVSLASRIPSVFPSSLWVGHGGLVSYGPDYRAQGVQAARLVAKIMRGARPQHLPVEGAHKVDLAVNLKTAAHLGVEVPRRVLLRANVIRR
jgi:putative tryptophan/tyrosine transport system substrate-binding protein